MTVEDVRDRVEMLRTIAGDDEAAHSHEDQLHFAVLDAIAKGACDDPKACAVEAIKSADIKFSRWCA